jgi:hypothetical protein
MKYFLKDKKKIKRKKIELKIKMENCLFMQIFPGKILFVF